MVFKKSTLGNILLRGKAYLGGTPAVLLSPGVTPKVRGAVDNAVNLARRGKELRQKGAANRHVRIVRSSSHPDQVIRYS